MMQDDMKNDNNLSQKRTISLPRGGELVIEMSDEFLLKIRKQFNLSDDDVIYDDHIRTFLWGAVNSALNKEKI